LNERRYTFDYELQEIEKSLNYEQLFDLEKIKKVFSESNVILPDSLVHNYEELLDFNKRLSIGRKDRLQDLRINFSMNANKLKTAF